MEARSPAILFRAVLLVGLVFLALSAFGGTTDPNTPDSKYLDFGKEFPSVCRVRALIVTGTSDKPDVSVQYGSGVIIRPNWLLTAGHVVKGHAAAFALKDDDSEHILEKVILHKDFSDDHFGFHDLALCYSSKDFGLKFYTPLYKKLDEVGQPITIAGYGVHGTFTTGAKLSDGKKRAGHNKIDSSERSVLICTPSVTNKFPLEFMIAQGDSGGGMFIGNELAGINSFLMAKDRKPDGTYGDESAFTRVSIYAEWIEEQILLHELSIAGKLTQAPNLDKVVPAHDSK